jgi:PAS domain S-box-containing protein
MTPESHEQIAAAIRRLFDTGEPYQLDLQITHSSGDARWALARGEVAERNPDGSVAVIRGTVQDITERKLVELALQRREQELRDVQRIAGVGSWRWEMATGKLSWSEEVYQLFERDRSLPPPSPEEHTAMFQPGQWAALSEALGKMVSEGQSYDVDSELALPSGKRRWIATRAEAAKGPDGQTVEIRGTVRDITHRKEAEETVARSAAETRQASEKLQAVLDSMTDGLAVRDRNGRYTYFSERAAQILGIDREAVLGKGMFEVFPGARETDIYAQTQLALSTGKPAHFDSFTGPPVNKWLENHYYPSEDGIAVYFRDITERKEAEAAIARSEAEARKASEKLQAVLDSITDGLAMLDKEWRYTYLSEPGSRLIGIRPEELLGKVVWEFLPQTDARGFGAAFREAVATRTPTHVVGYYPEPLNKWIECHNYPTEDGLSVYFRDISDLKQAEAAIRESQSRFQKLYDANLMGICYPDKFGAFFDGNDEFLRITGYTREELAAGLVRWDTMTPPEYAELDATHIAEAAERGSCTPYEKEYIRKDGSRVPILCGYALLEGSEDNYIGFIADLSAQKQAELAIRDREKRFRELAESLPQLVWEAKADTTITYVNRRWIEYTGFGVDEVAGTVARDLIHPDDMERATEQRMHSLQTGESYTGQVRMRRHDGAYRQFLARAVPILNDSGKVERWIGTLTDIHDQQLAEEALRRTEKLAATGRLAASIAHEINNPLEAVTNALYLALQMKVSDEAREYLKIAEQELARVAQVTTQTLRFHRQSTAAVSCDVAVVLDSALSLYLSRFRAAGIDVQRAYSPHAPLLCYPDELRQVFANLIGNALDATRSGGRLELRVRPSPAFNGVRVTIADTGHGIPAELRSRVFEAFLSTKQDTGTGLGLWVSEGIIRKHQGRISLRSRTSAPSGTVFSILLPNEAASQSGRGPRGETLR